MAIASEPGLEPLNRFVGTWNTEATHPALPGVTVRGTVVVEWLEGERFLIHRARSDHPDFPDSISIIGFTERDRADDAAGAGEPAAPELTMHYYDSRGVFRVYAARADGESWQFWRDAEGFSQRFSATFSDADTLAGRWQLCQDGTHWNDDLQITYRRRR